MKLHVVFVLFYFILFYFFSESICRNGVYDDPACDGKAVNHAVVLVGWGNLNGINYWIGRNSWGPGWGKEGYFLIQRGVNKCGIETYVGYAFV